MAFGPHGPRAPTSKPGEGFKVFLATLGLVGMAGIVHLVIHSFGKSFINCFFLKKVQFAHPISSVFVIAAPPPKTLTKEWQEASNERAKEMNLNPITGT